MWSPNSFATERSGLARIAPLRAAGIPLKVALFEPWLIEMNRLQ
jgi:hypothetical protein